MWLIVNQEVWNTSDGISWTKVSTNSSWTSEREYRGLVYNNIIYFKTNCNFKYSSDGITWNSLTSSGLSSCSNRSETLLFDSKIWHIGGNNGSYGQNDVWYLSL